MPVLAASMPFLSHWVAHAWFHTTIVLVVVPVAVLGLWNGYRLHHKRYVLWLGGGGILFVIAAVTFGRSGFWSEMVLMTFAGILLSAAHWINLTVCQRTH
jgi:hypothetical protein